MNHNPKPVDEQPEPEIRGGNRPTDYIPDLDSDAETFGLPRVRDPLTGFPDVYAAEDEDDERAYNDEGGHDAHTEF